MDSELRFLLILLIINTVVALAYTVLAYIFDKKQERTKHIIQGVISVICPIVGGMYFFLSWLMLKLFFNKALDYNDISFSNKRVKTLLAPDYYREINMVPIEDAIAVSDKYSLRRLLLDVLKNDRENSLPAIVLSLSSTDSETSHYAASVLMDVISEFSKTVGVLNTKFKTNPKENTSDGIEMILLILYYLTQNIFSPIQAGTYLTMANQIGDTIFEEDSLILNEAVMLSFTEQFLIYDNISNAEKWAQRLGRVYPHTLQRYIANLKVYYTKGMKNDFFALLEDLKKTNITVNYEILMMIRLFGGFDTFSDTE